MLKDMLASSGPQSGERGEGIAPVRRGFVYAKGLAVQRPERGRRRRRRVARGPQARAEIERSRLPDSRLTGVAMRAEVAGNRAVSAEVHEPEAALKRGVAGRLGVGRRVRIVS